MLMKNDKVSTSTGGKVTEITKNVSNYLQKLQDQDPNLKRYLEKVRIEASEEVPLNEKDKRAFLIKVSEESWKTISPVHADLIKKLEGHFNCPIIIVANRNMINGKLFKKFKGKLTPRQNTLTSVYDNLLEDILYPAAIIGKRIRHFRTGKRLFKVHIDGVDREHIGHKSAALEKCYRKLTNRDLKIEILENKKDI
jgi:small subunit ribosomal protein S7e